MTSDNKTIGMISFIDPQKLNKGKDFALNKKSDIYSLGMVLWEISNCRKPFPAGEELVLLSLSICNGYEKNLSKELKYNIYGSIQIVGNKNRVLDL